MSSLFKTGDMNDLNNYRPISVLPVQSKTIERHLHDHLLENLNVHRKQSGFRKPNSTETTIAFIVDNTINGLVHVDYNKKTNIRLDLSSDNVQDIENILSCVVANVDEWAVNNKLPLNCSKTKIILIDGQRLRKYPGLES